MLTKDLNLEQNVCDTDLSFEKILEEAYQRSGGTKGTKGPEQDERIKDKTFCKCTKNRARRKSPRPWVLSCDCQYTEHCMIPKITHNK